MAEMKDSGIHAIGRIPKEWNVVRTKYLSNISIGLVTTMTENYVEKEEGVPLIRNGNIRCNKIDVNGMVFLDKRFAEKNKHRQLHTGQIATVHTGDVGTSIVIPEEYDGGLGFATIQSTPYKGVSSEFLCWFYNSAAFKNQCIECSTGDGRQNLNLYDFVDLFVAIPKYDLQSKIASFLDKKCAEIDSLHTDIEKQIEILEEYKKSIITEAVTKGLNSAVEMKESGIEWIGKIPKSWMTSPLKYNYYLITGATPDSSNSELWDGDIQWITPADFKTRDIYVFEGSRKLTVLGYNSCSTTIVPAGSIIFSKRAPIGSVVICKEKICTNQGCISLVAKNSTVNNKYYYYVLSIYNDVFNLMGSGTTFKEISTTIFGNVMLPYPDKSAQNEIADFLDSKCLEIDFVIKEKKEQLETLEQYKKSLIYEYVTGKKEVK